MTNGDMVFLLLMGIFAGASLMKFDQRRDWWDLGFVAAYLWCAAATMLRHWTV